MVAPVELVKSVLREDWLEDYTASKHWGRYWNAVSAPSDDDWPEGLTEDGDRLFLKDKLLVPESRVEDLINHWHNAQLMHPVWDKMQQDLEGGFKFPPGYHAILDKYCSNGAVCRATKSPNHSTAGNPVYTAISPMRSVAMDVFAMPEVTVKGETYDCVILDVDGHSWYIVAVPGKRSKKKDKKDKHGEGLQSRTVANAVMWHWLTIFDVPAVICSHRGSQFVGAWFRTIGKHMGIRQAKTVSYHSRSNGRAEVAGHRSLRSSASSTSTNRVRLGTTPCGVGSRRTTIFRRPRDCCPIAFCSCVIECHALSRGGTTARSPGMRMP